MSEKEVGRMSNSQLIQQMALLNWLQLDSVESKEMLTAVTGIQVALELHDRLTGQSKVDRYKRECILSVADYVKKNPRASQKDLNAEVEKQVQLFAIRLQALDSTTLL